MGPTACVARSRENLTTVYGDRSILHGGATERQEWPGRIAGRTKRNARLNPNKS